MINSENTLLIDNGSQNIRTSLNNVQMQYLNSKFIKKQTGQINLCDQIDVDEEYQSNVINSLTRGILTKLDNQTAIWERMF